MDTDLNPFVGTANEGDHGWCRAQAEITDLLHAYAAAIDARNWREFADVFTPDAMADFGELGGKIAGKTAISDYCASALGRFAATQHLIANVRITSWARDAAKTTCSLVAIHVNSDGSAPFLVGGTYRDDVQRTPQGWRISRRHLVVIWQSGPEQGFLFPGSAVGGGSQESEG